MSFRYEVPLIRIQDAASVVGLLDKVMALGLHPGNSAEPTLREQNKFIDLLNEQFGNVLSIEEIEKRQVGAII